MAIIAREAIAEADLQTKKMLGHFKDGRFKLSVYGTQYFVGQYHKSIMALQHIAYNLENMSNHVAARTAIIVRDRLRVITMEANAENDQSFIKMLKATKAYAYEVDTGLSGEANIKTPKAVDSGNKQMENSRRSDRDTSKPKTQTHLQSGSTTPKSSDRPVPPLPPPTSSQHQPTDTDSAREQSLLEELFPEVSPAPPAKLAEKRPQYPKLDLPRPDLSIRPEYVESPKSLKEQVVESLKKTGEEITVLQLSNCSTGLTEADFRRIIPKGKHIDTWNREAEFYKVIPGRNPLNLERLPFYYLLFKSPESALAYQKNASRLHKLAALHQSSDMLSAIPLPKGFLEDGEDISAATASYLLKPPNHPLTLHTIMQPYHPALRTLFEEGNYRPITPDIDERGNRIYKVLMYIEGYEPSKSDLFKILTRDAYTRGFTLALSTESSSSIHRLRDIMNLKTQIKPVSSTNPRAHNQWETRSLESKQRDANRMTIDFEDPSIAYYMRTGNDEGDNVKEVNQIVMDKVYNRWLIEFDDEDSARRFAVAWHRRVLPYLTADRTWRDYEVVRMCNCEFLW